MNKALKIAAVTIGDGVSMSVDLDFAKDPFWFDSTGLIDGVLASASELQNFFARKPMASQPVGATNVLLGTYSGAVTYSLSGSVLTVTLNPGFSPPPVGQINVLSATLLF